MLGHLFVQSLPYGTPAFRVAFMSAAFNAAAAVGIMCSVQRWFLLLRSNPRQLPAGGGPRASGSTGSSSGWAGASASSSTTTATAASSGGGDGSEGGGEEEWVGSVWPGVFAGGMYALCPLVWSYSVQVPAHTPALFRLRYSALTYLRSSLCSWSVVLLNPGALYHT